MSMSSNWGLPNPVRVVRTTKTTEEEFDKDGNITKRVTVEETETEYPANHYPNSPGINPPFGTPYIATYND